MMATLFRNSGITFIIIISGLLHMFPDTTDWNVSVFYDNDSFLNTDRAYTAGIQFIVMIPATSNISNLPSLISFIRYNSDYRFKFGLSYKKSLYTPDNISIIELVPGNRPYAGYNFIGVSLLGYNRRKMESVEAGIGIIGPLSGAEYLQKSIHRLVGSKTPLGWDNQLKHEYIFQLFYDRFRKLKYIEIMKSAGLELSSRTGAGIGNGLIYVSGGLSLRGGIEIRDDFGIPADRPGGQCSPIHLRNNSSGLYGFLSFDIFYNFRNVFLDGNLFRESHSVEKYSLSADINTGIVLRFTNLHVLLRYVHWTKRYVGELFPHRYIKLGFSYFF